METNENNLPTGVYVHRYGWTHYEIYYLRCVNGRKKLCDPKRRIRTTWAKLITSNITIDLSHISARNITYLISVVLYSVPLVIEACVGLHGVIGTAPYSPTPFRGLDYW